MTKTLAAKLRDSLTEKEDQKVVDIEDILAADQFLGSFEDLLSEFQEQAEDELEDGDPLEIAYFGSLQALCMFQMLTHLHPDLSHFNLAMENGLEVMKDLDEEEKATFLSYLQPYFSCDVKLSEEGTTLVGLMLELNDLFPCDEGLLEGLAQMRDSRMGFYEVLSTDEDTITLKDIFTDEEYVVLWQCDTDTTPGDVWLTRLFGNVMEIEYYLPVTLPTVFDGTTATQWRQLFATHFGLPAEGIVSNLEVSDLMINKLPIEYWVETLSKDAELDEVILRYEGLPQMPTADQKLLDD